ncbi:MAG TPA: PA domain-containing protein [Actinomycetota bacterium]|nr:PA domain-containing protein [Actinomycetota bacterium]
MRRRILILVAAGLAALSFAGIAPATAQVSGDFAPFVSIAAAPDGAQVTAGENFDGTELTNSRQLAEGPVGPAPAFVADDGFGCAYGTAAASGLTEWIAVARRGMTAAEGTDRCPGFQTKLSIATAAGADGLIIINHSPGHEAGTAAGVIPGIMIDKGQGDRLVASLDPTKPDAVKIRLGLLDIITFLPPNTIQPTTLSGVTARRNGGTLTVSGQAAFGGQAPVELGLDDPGDPPIHADMARFGLDATSISIGQPVPGGDIDFVIKVTRMESQPPPELIRYLWQFRVAEKEYWVQAKTSDFSTATATADDPAGTATHVPGNFRLRGDCATVGVVASCKHLAWLSGSFDTAADEVHIRLPLNLAVAPVIAPGAVIEPEDGMTASVQAVISNASTSDTVAQENPYTITSREVAVGIVPSGSAPAYSTTATVNEDGSFSADLDVSGKSSGSYDVVTKACFGSNCDRKAVQVTL